MKSGSSRRYQLLFFLLYGSTVLWFTVLKRSAVFSPAKTELFWSYRQWLDGNQKIGRQILLNIAMFFPFGFFLGGLLKRRARLITVAVSAAVFSLLIESLQFILMRGLFELDDVVSNTLGALLGLGFAVLLEKYTDRKRLPVLKNAIGLVFVCVCFGVYLYYRGTANQGADSTSRAYCFQVDSATLDGRALTLNGFAFRCAHPEAAPVLSLRASGSGEKKPLTIIERCARPDVNRYFSCEFDYTDSGFTASADVEPDREYEIMIRWPWSPLLHTGVYLTGTDIHYVPEKEFAAPALEADFVTDGTIRVYRPDFHCWVYQYDGALYWIADRGFLFDEDGKTLIQYQMWTTQIERLPARRLAHDNLWDNISADFEAYELDGDYGNYRVMRRELPQAYSLLSIVTGFYQDGSWVWKNYFRPIYSF
ncbi:MAG: VanZ family protein [Oscillospiraceae bacterium]|nr:VanZ family protein [Oscillospiraceae bacterium]